MKFLDNLKKNSDLINKSKEYSLTDLFKDIDIGDKNNSKEILALAENLNKSIVDNEKYVYTATTFEKALQKASKDLNINKKEIDYKLIQDSAKNFFGITKRLCIIKVLNFIEQNNEKNYLDLNDIKEVSMKALNPSGVDITINENGVFLKKIDSQFNEDLLIDEIKKRYSGYIDTRVIVSFLTSSKEKKIQLGHYIANVSENISITITTSDQDALAYVYVSRPGLNGRDIAKGDIARFLESKEIKDEYIKKETIQMIEEKKIYDKKILIAEAEKAVNAKNEEIIFDIEVEKKVNTNNDKIDFKNIDPVINVERGELIFHKSVITENRDGIDIYGNLIISKQGLELDLSKIIDAGIELDEDNIEARALTSGQLLKSAKGEYSVREVMTINGDVGPKTGNINFKGSVEVSGNILSGYDVKVGGNLKVKKSIESCNIDVEGDIVVKLGINGNRDAVIKCNNLYGKFVQDSKLFLKKGLFLEEGIIRSQVYSNDNIIINGKRANIIMSEVYAKNLIEAKTIGSNNESKVSVKVGYPGIIRKKLEIINDKYLKIGPLLTSLNLRIEDMEKKGPVFIAKNQDRYDKLLEERKEKEPKVLEYEEQKIKLENKMLADKNIEGEIRVEEKTYGGVTVVCCDAELEIKRENSSMIYKVNENNLKFIYLQKNENPTGRNRR